MTDHHAWEDLNSDKALVCKREINSDHGHAIVHCVVLSDGFIIECGLNEMRAKVLALAVNQFGPERFSKTALNA